MCTVLMPPGVNPIAVNKYINIKSNLIRFHITVYPTRNNAVCDINVWSHCDLQLLYETFYSVVNVSGLDGG